MWIRRNLRETVVSIRNVIPRPREGRGGGVTPWCNPSMCRPIGWGFCAVLVWKRVYTLPILVWNRVWFLREPTGAYERIYRFNSKWVRKKEKCWRTLLGVLAGSNNKQQDRRVLVQSTLINSSVRCHEVSATCILQFSARSVLHAFFYQPGNQLLGVSRMLT